MPHQEEENFAEDRVLQVILGLVVLKLYVQTVLDANFHLDGVVGLRLLWQRCAESMNMAACSRLPAVATITGLQGNAAIISLRFARTHRHALEWSPHARFDCYIAEGW